MANIFYYLTAALLIYIHVIPSFYAKNERKNSVSRKMNELDEKISLQIVATRERFVSYVGETKQWQEELDTRIFELGTTLSAIKAKKVTDQNLDDIQDGIEEIENALKSILSDRAVFMESKKELQSFLNDQRAIAIETGQKSEMIVEWIENLSETDPIGAFEQMAKYQERSRRKKTKRA
jgi:uncharacterized phage infection (PIP) family protein YhgE